MDDGSPKCKVRVQTKKYDKKKQPVVADIK